MTKKPTMTTRIEALWADIARSQTTRQGDAGTFTLRRVDPDGALDIFAGVDSSAFVMLAIGVRSTPPAIELDSSSLDYFRQKRRDGSWLMALRLRQSDLTGVFGRLCQDLLDATEDVADDRALVALFKDRLNLWKKLFRDNGNGLLRDHEVKGLIAELLTLKSMLEASGRRPEEIVSAWVGPFGADQDFLFGDEAVEVKAVGPSADAISISSLQQLDCAAPLSIRVLTMRAATPGEADAVNLNELARELEGQLASDPDALAAFRARLLEACYVEHEHYDSVVFQPTRREVFAVNDRFPRLTAAAVPTGISSASYCIALDRLRILE